MRAVLEPIEVDVGPSGRPLRLRWRGRTWRVTDTRDAWQAGGRWWLGEPDRAYWLLECGRARLEVYVELGGERRWVLSRVED